MALRGNLAFITALSMLGCTPDAPAKKVSISSSLLKHMNFKRGMLLNGPMPGATDNKATLLPLGPATVVKPGGSGLMALEVHDPEDRPVEATLMQFGDNEDQHIRIPTLEGGGSDLLENEFSVGEALCDGLCDVVFSVIVIEAVEFEDGKIAKASQRQIAVDCREHGDASACDEEADGGVQGGLLCGDVTEGEVALSGDPVIDAHLDALRELGAAERVAATRVGDAFELMATSLDLADDASGNEIATELEARIAAATDAGLSALLGDLACGLRWAIISHALESCDPDGVSSLQSISCTGICEPEAGQEAACAAADSGGCRAFLDTAACSGECIGSCAVTLADPASCAGTCDGTCDAECPDDGSGGCLGPCAGLCTGSCETLSNGACDGTCDGLCHDATVDPQSCDEPLVAYCDSPAGAAIDCPGDCFGDVTVGDGIALCRATSVSVGRIKPRCEPPRIKLSFALQAGLSAAQQNAFSALLEDIRDPLAVAFTELSPVSLLVTANTELLDASQNGIADRIADRLTDAPDDSGLVCASESLDEQTAWLQEQQTAIEALHAEVMAVLSTLMISP